MGPILKACVDIFVMIMNIQIPVFPSLSIPIKGFIIGGFGLFISFKFIRGLFS